MTRKEALSLNLTRYHGKPCKRCGGTEKYTKSSTCTSCVAKRTKKFQEENPEKVRQYSKDWNSRNPEKRKSINKSWQDNNKSQYLEIQRNWYQRNKSQSNFYTAKYRAAKDERTPQWADLDKIKDVYLWAHLASIVTGVEHHVDHVVPLRGKNVSGLHVEDNLEVIPYWENLEKSCTFKT